MGRKKRPFYRIVAADSRAPRDGRFIETLGTYNPLTKPHTVEFDEERVLYWLKNGAQPSQTVRSLFKQKGLWLKWDLMKRGADEAKIAEEYAKWEVLQIEKAKRQAAKEEEQRKAKEKEAKEEKTEAAPEQAAAEETAPEEAPAQEEATEPQAEAAVQEETPADQEDQNPEKSE